MFSAWNIKTQVNTVRASWSSLKKSVSYYKYDGLSELPYFTKYCIRWYYGARINFVLLWWIACYVDAILTLKSLNFSTQQVNVFRIQMSDVYWTDQTSIYCIIIVSVSQRTMRIAQRFIVSRDWNLILILLWFQNGDTQRKMVCFLTLMF